MIPRLLEQPLESDTVLVLVNALDEEGTEAAAATAAVFTKSLEARFDMQVDRPFAVAVRRIESGDLLFAAWVDDPGRSEPDR